MKSYEAEDILLNGDFLQDIVEAGFKYVSLICPVHVHKEPLYKS